MERIKAALVFTGQGVSLMEVAKKYELLSGINGTLLRDRFEQMSEAFRKYTGDSLPKPTDLLGGAENSFARYAQPFICLLSMVDYENLIKSPSWGNYNPKAIAGYSFGEYPALIASGVIENYEQGCNVVVNRALETAKACQTMPGRLIRVIGAGVEHINSITKLDCGPWVALDNAPKVVVLGCKKGDIESVKAGIRGIGGKVRTEELDTIPGAYHTPLMQPAADAMRAFLAKIGLKNPNIPVYANIDARQHTDGEELKDILPLSLTQTVQWRKFLLGLEGIGALIELGPGGMIAKLSQINGSPIPVLNSLTA